MAQNNKQMITPYALPGNGNIDLIDRKVGLRHEEVAAQKQQNIWAGIGVYMVLQALVLAVTLLMWFVWELPSLTGVGVFSGMSVMAGMAFSGTLFAVRGSRDEWAIIKERNELIDMAAKAELRAENAERELKMEQEIANQLRNELRLAFPDANRDSKFVAASTESQAALEDAVVLYKALLRNVGSREAFRDGKPGVTWGQRRWERARDVLTTAGVMWEQNGKPAWLTDEAKGMQALKTLKIRSGQAQATKVATNLAEDDDD